MAVSSKKQRVSNDRIENPENVKIDIKPCFGSEIEDPEIPSPVSSDNIARPNLAFPRQNYPIRQIKTEISKSIFSQDRDAQSVASVMSTESPAKSMLGVGFGGHEYLPGNFNSNTISIFLEELESEEVVRRFIFDKLDLTDVADDDFPIALNHCGPIDARDVQFPNVPIHCGLEIGHIKGEGYGTLGCLARGDDKERSNKILLLSNNHVIGRTNKANFGDLILSKNCLIARFDRSVPINFGERSTNLVDAATAWCWHERVRPEMMYPSGTNWDYLNISNMPRDPEFGMRVAKCGRSTGLTEGRITVVELDIKVNYGPMKIANFINQIAIESEDKRFSEPGDSGSLIYSCGAQKHAIGLLFAGAKNFTFANKISDVIGALKIQLLTQCEYGE